MSFGVSAEPATALREWLMLLVDLLDAKRGMAEAMDTLIGGPEPLDSKTPHRRAARARLRSGPPTEAWGERHRVEVGAVVVVLATRDHTVHPDFQRWVSKRMGAAVTEVESSHVPMLSHPEIVIDVVRNAAAAVQSR
jgi:hypothetical protein